METVGQDLRYAVRLLGRKPGLIIVAVITLALGIGVNSAIFSVVNGILLRPLPYKEPDRLVQVWESNFSGGFSLNTVSHVNFLDWRKSSESFEELGAFDFWFPALTGGDEPLELEGARVSANFFSLLGVSAEIGRTFLLEEEQAGKNRVVVISNSLWRGRFGADPDVVGKTLTFDDNVYTIVGVLGRDFQHPETLYARKAQIWAPLAPETDPAKRGSRFLRVIGRLGPGFTFKQAQAEMDTIARGLEQAHPATNSGWGVSLVPLHEEVTGRIRPALLLLQGAVGFILLIACANIANLLLARVASRVRETAIRSALGASRSRLIRQFLTESLLLAGLGGAIGLGLAMAGVELFLSIVPRDIPRLEEVRLDGRVLGFTLAVSLLTAVVFGLAPALHATRVNLNEALKEGGRESAGGRSGLRSLLVVAEVALSLVLLIGAGLLVKSFYRLQSIDPGFDPANVLTMRLSLPNSFSEQRQLRSFYDQALARVASLAGVEAAGISTTLPLTGFNDIGIGIEVEGRPPVTPEAAPGGQYRVISPGYFRAMKIPLLSGRHFNESDNADAARVAIISDAMARSYFPGEDPIGKRVTPGFGGNTPREIVGVVASVKHNALSKDAEPEIYVPYAQQAAWGNAFLVVRAEVNRGSLVAAVRDALWEIDKDVPVSDIASMEDVLAGSVSRPRFNALLLGLFAAVALLLAAVGVYGVMSYTVQQSTREIGIRMAVGAQVGDVLKLVIGQGLVLTLIGVAFGVAGSLALTRLMSSLLYGVTATDPVIFIIVPALLVVVALVACYIPARRAAKVDPMVALRYE